MKIDGYIFDAVDNAPVNNAIIELVSISTGKRQGDPFQLDNNSYEVWAELPDLVSVSFKAPGHIERIIPFNALEVAPDIYMERGGKPPIGAILVISATALLLTTTKKQKRIGAAGESGKKMTTQDVMPVIYIGGFIFGISIVNKILDKLGLTGSKKRHNEVEDPNSAFKPAYYKRYTSYTYAITTSQAEAFAYVIHNAFGVFQDDYNAVLSVFNQMRTKCNVSFLADIFFQEYSEDLLNFLTDGGGILPWDGLSREHLDEIIDLVNNLPSN
jgi:hypothetical protein